MKISNNGAKFSGLYIFLAVFFYSCIKNSSVQIVATTDVSEISRTSGIVTLNGMSFAAPGVGIAVGDGGTILRISN